MGDEELFVRYCVVLRYGLYKACQAIGAQMDLSARRM